MKNRPSTTAKFYIQTWNNRETVRLAMQCISDFTVSSSTETAEDLSFTEEKMETSSTKVSEWMADQAELLTSTFDANLSDESLQNILDGNNNHFKYILLFHNIFLSFSLQI